MKYPRHIVNIGNCIAVWKEAFGVRKVAGPALCDYPFVSFDGEVWQAHRLSFHLNHKKIPCKPNNRKTGLICHTCDNKWCINPNHLYYGTCSQNIKEAFERHPTLHMNVKIAANNRPPISDITRKRMSKSHKGHFVKSSYKKAYV